MADQEKIGVVFVCFDPIARVAGPSKPATRLEELESERSPPQQQLVVGTEEIDPLQCDRPDLLPFASPILRYSRIHQFLRA
jgi:hypothetical protein